MKTASVCLLRIFSIWLLVNRHTFYTPETTLHNNANVCPRKQYSYRVMTHDTLLMGIKSHWELHFIALFKHLLQFFLLFSLPNYCLDLTFISVAFICVCVQVLLTCMDEYLFMLFIEATCIFKRRAVIVTMIWHLWMHINYVATFGHDQYHRG